MPLRSCTKIFEEANYLPYITTELVQTGPALGVDTVRQDRGPYAVGFKPPGRTQPDSFRGANAATCKSSVTHGQEPDWLGPKDPAKDPIGVLLK